MLVLHAKDSFKTSNDLKREFNAPIANRTFQYRLQKVGLVGKSPRKVPFLSEFNIQQRLKFASAHFIRQNWRNVLWSDETKINLFRSDGKCYVTF